MDFRSPFVDRTSKIRRMRKQLPSVLVLSERDTPFTLFSHASAIKSLQQAAEERSQTPQQIVRSILFRMSENHFIMVLIAGPAQISWIKLRTYLGKSRITLATQAEVFRVTGYQIGSVSPFGLSHPIRILADHNVFENAEISLGSGNPGTAIIMKSIDLKRILENIEISNFSTIYPETS